jgi:hypothetical protein
VLCAAACDDPEVVEALLHRILAKHRYSPWKEFFKLPKTQVINYFFGRIGMRSRTLREKIFVLPDVVDQSDGLSATSETRRCGTCATFSGMAVR